MQHMTAPATEILRVHPLSYFVRRSAMIEINGEKGRIQKVARLVTASVLVIIRSLPFVKETKFQPQAY
jgi:hypothetical protein